MKRVVYLALIIVVLGFGVWRLRAISSNGDAAEITIPMGEITSGALVVTLPVSGFLESAEEIPARSEIAGFLIEICKDNTLVKPGDFIFQLDTKELTDERDDLVRALTDAQEALNSQQADSLTSMTQAQSEADAAEDSLQLAKEKAQAEREKIAAQVKYAEGETARSERELSRAQRLANMNYIPGTKLREAEKAHRRQQFALEQQRAQQADVEKRTDEQVKDAQGALDLARHSLVTGKAHTQSHIQDARIGVAEAQRKLDEVDKKIAQCTVTAPAAGMAVIETNATNWPERRPYRLGDQVQSGAAPVKIYDFRKMQVRSQIGEMDISRVHRGQEVFVSSPTQPGSRYRGKVAVVEELAQESNVWQGGTPGKKVFSVLVTLSETDPAHLRPGMTVDLEIVLDSIRKATMLPIRAIFKEGGGSYIYRENGKTFERIPVKTGKRNDLLIEVSGKVGIGERVALERPPAALVQPAGVKP